MNNVQDLIFEYNGILDFVKKCAESGLEEFIEIEERLSSFGENLNAFLFSSLEEINNLKNELNTQKLEADEIIAQLNKKLKGLSGTMTQADYKLCSVACQKDYEQYWALLEEDSKKFLTTAYFVLRKIKATNSDFSVAVLCLCKPFEKELVDKIYLPFVVEESKLPIIEKDKGKLREGVEFYKKNNDFFVPFKFMLSSFRKPAYLGGYWVRLHNKLCKENWDLIKLGDENFIDSGTKYLDEHRNAAVHLGVLCEQNAMNCKTKTRELLTYFISAHPKSK